MTLALIQVVILTSLLQCHQLSAQQDKTVNNNDERRCYCNEPSCVTTSYMCKSTLGLCFAQHSPDVAHIRYACAESLPTDAERHLCVTVASTPITDTQTDDVSYVIRQRRLSSHDAVTWSELACCSTDMCNYYYFRSRATVDDETGSSANVTSSEQHQQPASDEERADDHLLTSYNCAHVVVMVTIPLCFAVLLTLAAILTLYALSLRRRRMTSLPVYGGYRKCNCSGHVPTKSYVDNSTRSSTKQQCHSDCMHIDADTQHHQFSPYCNNNDVISSTDVIGYSEKGDCIDVRVQSLRHNHHDNNDNDDDNDGYSTNTTTPANDSTSLLIQSLRTN